MNGFDLIAVITVCVFAMPTIIACKVSSDRRTVRIAQAREGNIVLHANAVTGEVIGTEEPKKVKKVKVQTEERMPAQVGINQTGVWAKP